MNSTQMTLDIIRDTTRNRFEVDSFRDIVTILFEYAPSTISFEVFNTATGEYVSDEVIQDEIDHIIRNLRRFKTRISK